MRDLVEIERNVDEASGVTLRIMGVDRPRPFRVVELREGHGPDERWNRVGGVHDDLESARADARSYGRHVVELRGLVREDLPTGRVGQRTPWGEAQDATAYGPGVTKYHTAGHGGYKLDRANNATVHPDLRVAGGWYEEDCDWAVVAHTFPHLFTERERGFARETLVNWKPHAFMAATGTVVQVHESRVLREEAFRESNKDRWVVVSASRGTNGNVIATATLGGIREMSSETRTFDLEPGVYRQGEFGFVVDPSVHAEVEQDPGGLRP